MLPSEEQYAGSQTTPVQTPPQELESGVDHKARPVDMPPEYEEENKGTAASAEVWHGGKKITALWSIDENRNSWIGVAGLGWKKLANNSDSGVMAMTMLTSHARSKASTVSLKEEAGQIREVYVW